MRKNAMLFKIELIGLPLNFETEKNYFVKLTRIITVIYYFLA